MGFGDPHQRAEYLRTGAGCTSCVSSGNHFAVHLGIDRESIQTIPTLPSRSIAPKLGYWNNLVDLRRATGMAIYNVWGHAYSIQALVRMHGRHYQTMRRSKNRSSS